MVQALVATLGDCRQFHSTRHLAANLGPVPQQQSSGGKTVLRGISKRGRIHGSGSMFEMISKTKEWEKKRSRYSKKWDNCGMQSTCWH